MPSACVQWSPSHVQTLTLAVVGAEGDDSLSVLSVGAGLVGAVANTVAEVRVAAETSGIARGGAAKRGRLVLHVGDACLL